MADADARVWVELRLLLDNFKKEGKQAASILRNEMVDVSAKISAGTAPAKGTADIDKKTAAIVKNTNALKDNKKAELERWRAAHPGGIVPGQVISFGETKMVKGLPQGPISMGPIVSNLATAIPQALAKSAQAYRLAHPMYLAQGARQLMGMGPLQFPQQTMHMAPNWQLAQGARQLMGMGPLQFPQQTMHMAPNWQLAQGAKSLLGMGPLFPQYTGPTSPKLPAPQANSISGVQGAKSLLGMGPLFPQYTGPTPPKLPAPQANSISGLVSGWLNKSLSGPQQGIFKVTAALAALRAGIGLASYALRLILAPAEKLARVFLEASESARRLYASSLQSGGMPIKFTQFRQSLATVIGVGENEVLQYGDAIRSMTNDLRLSNKVISDTAPTLTAMGWEWKILGQDMKALYAMIAYGMTPVMHVFFNTVHAGLTNLIYAARLFAALPGFQGAQWLLKQIGQGAPEAPPPTASARRYQTSAFERAGLVLGNYGATNSAQETASNTRKMTVQLQRMIDIAQRTHPQLYRKEFGAAMP